MSTDRQKSFIATIGIQTDLVHFLDVVNGAPATVTSPLFSGGHFSGKPQSRNDSHLLGIRPEPRLTLYFRHTEQGYRLYIRTPGPYYGKCLSLDKNGILGAFDPEGSNVYQLIGKQGIPLSIDNHQSNKLEAYLKVSGSPGLLHTHKLHDSTFTYFADKGGRPFKFRFTILERNASYIDRPDEI
ncbi:hypothetical protein [Pseudomonas sp. BW7P1]|uniref:hypothetical protein n=1 Tax=Pseudomonas TaxID=286 RepID=UPI0021ADA3E6|nr:hypothetical protein [Pseudomonas sp. BW7P1]UWI61207.1 hypothetical protein NWV16_24510 [Pseudomonas sp. BW7P1]